MIQFRFAEERGSAVADFVLVSVPILFLALSVLGLSLAAYTRLVLIDTAIEAARFSALADQSDSDGCARAKLLFSKTFGANSVLHANCFTDQINGREYSRAVLSSELINLGFITFGPEIKASAKAIRELQG
ncbi:MAG: TadE/TadG family type IV pilus assembly protein [Rhodoluna sp.]